MALALCYLFFARASWLTWAEPAAERVGLRFDPRSFAYVMAMLTSLIAAVCTAFCAILFTARDELGDPVHSLSHVTALVVAIFASIAATLGFGATYAIPLSRGSTPPTTFPFFLLIMSFLQLAISTGIAGITLIPIVNNRKDVFVNPLIKAISSIFWLPAGWVFLFLLAVPGVFRLAAPMFWFLLACAMGQAFFPHGLFVSDMKTYKALMWSFASLGFAGLTTATIVAGACTILSIAIPSPPEWCYAAAVDAIFGVIGVAIWFYSVYIEGIRKVDKETFARA
ncbi:MAG TPA: hypothetical protein VF363_00810 [Candidatus Eisenbacteria bacterium]